MCIGALRDYLAALDSAATATARETARELLAAVCTPKLADSNLKSAAARMLGVDVRRVTTACSHRKQADSLRPGGDNWKFLFCK
jgi:hypothetical protein